MSLDLHLSISSPACQWLSLFSSVISCYECEACLWILIFQVWQRSEFWLGGGVWCGGGGGGICLCVFLFCLSLISSSSTSILLVTLLSYHLTYFGLHAQRISVQRVVGGHCQDITRISTWQHRVWPSGNCLGFYFFFLKEFFLLFLASLCQLDGAIIAGMTDMWLHGLTSKKMGGDIGQIQSSYFG